MNDPNNVLIVEDEILIAMNLKLMLNEMGYASSIVNNALDAIKEAKDNNPYLILMDISLNGSLSGIDAAVSISHTDIPIIFTTAYQNKETLLRTKISENYGFLIKPIFREDLRREIAKVIGKTKKNLP